MENLSKKDNEVEKKVKKRYRAKIVKNLMDDTLAARSLYLVRCLETEDMSTERMLWHVLMLRAIRYLRDSIDSMIHQAELAEAAISSND